MLAPYPNARVLDVGGGHGQLVDALLRNGYRVMVLGSSEECRTRIIPWLEKGQIAFSAGHILDLPFSDRAFDVVISYRLLPHMTQWREFLEELARVAGKAVLVDYTEARSVNVLARWFYQIKKQLEPNTRRYRCLREKELLRVFQASGFCRSERFPQYFLPMALHRALNRPGFSISCERLFRRTRLTSLFGSPVILKVGRAV
jgi:2-polyprenyl-3-methyl-5-hydroxy-6-metoxy-1,4-benzoquinol methylase